MDNSGNFQPQQEAPKFIVESAEEFDNGADIPEAYGDNRLVIMVRDPVWFFAYWDIANDRYEEITRQNGQQVWQEGQQILRVYDISNEGRSDGSSRPRFFDVDVQFDSRNWYVNVDQSGRTYRAELGLRLKDGRFLCILSSNCITMPFGRVSDLTDADWVSVDYSLEEWTQMMHVGALQRSSANLPEAAQVNRMALRWEFLRAVFSGAFSQSKPFEFGISSSVSSYSGSRSLPPQQTKEKPNG